jgi:YD repeat-containing protein
MKNSLSMPAHIGFGSNILRDFLFVLLATAFLASFASAQAPLPLNQVGLPSNGVYSGGTIDSVQLNNGNLHVDIPLLHLPGIGMDTDIHFVYDNKIWTFQEYIPSGQAGYVWVNQTRGLWLYQDPLQGFVSENSTTNYYNCVAEGSGVEVPYQTPSVTYVSFTDGDGTNHFFPGLAGYPSDVSPGCNISWLPGHDYSEDSSGYKATTNALGNVSTITDKHGRTFTMQSLNDLALGAPGYPDEYGVVSVEDTNGNRMTNSSVAGTSGSPSTYTLTDTVNRKIVTSTTAGSTPTQTIAYLDQNGNTQTITINYVTVPISFIAMCVDLGWTAGAVGCSQYDYPNYAATVVNESLPGSFVLQNGDTYTITYNSSGYGEIQSITLPTGAAISYTYGNWDGTGEQVLTRTVEVDGVSSEWTYNYAPQEAVSGVPDTGNGQVSDIVTVTDPDSNATAYTCTIYYPNNTGVNIVGTPPCYMTEEQIYSGGTSGTLIATKATTYTVNEAILPTQEVFTWNSTGQTAETDTTWDTELLDRYGSFGNVLSKVVYDFGSGSHGPLLSNTQYTYLFNQNSAYQTANMLDRVAQVSIYNSITPSSSSLVAQSTTAYDAFNQSSQSSLVATTGTTQHDYTNYSTSNTLRGLPTSVTKYTGPSTPTITSYVDYNDVGKPTVAADARGYSTTFTYGTQNAFVATTTMPATSGVNHTVTTNYDSNTGLLNYQIDQNSKQTSYTYDDRMRPLTISRPDGGSTTYAYPDPNHVNTTTAECSSSSTNCTVAPASITSSVTLDGLGRKILSSTDTGDSCVAINVATTYDLMGRVSTVSNPYCTGSSAPVTTFSYDAINRKIKTLNADNTTYQTWSYNGSTVTATDESGNQWQQTSDALGRLTQVEEPNGVSTAPSMITNYTYDALNNLLSVTQFGISTYSVARSFTYDGLSRLLTATNPETGTIGYAYDANGNLHTKTDARNIVTTYTYDALNRLTNKSYSDGVTLPVNFTYDTSSISGNSNVIGRLTGESVTNGSTVVANRVPYAYDPVGRLKGELQCTPSTASTCSTTASSAYSEIYSYDLAGNLTSTESTLPSTVTGTPSSSMTFSYVHDPASRLATVTSSLPASANYPPDLFQTTASSSQSAYGPFGLTNASLGVNGSTTTASLVRTYDVRGRIASETDSTADTVPLTPATASAGTITITGTEQSTTTSSTPGTGAVMITQTSQNGGGTVYVYVNGVATSYSFSFSSTFNALSAAQGLAQAINSNSSMPVTATATGGGTEGVVVLNAKTGGSGTNYTLSATDPGATGMTISTSGSTLTGGTTGALTYDTGTIKVTINEKNASYSWGQNSNPTTIAQNLVTVINSADGSFLTASNSGGVIRLASKGTGVETNWVIYTTVTNTNSAFTTSSFSAVDSGMSGGSEATTDPNGVVYSYVIPATGGYFPNGNLESVTDSVTGTWNYTYDTLNRLLTATPTAGNYVGYYGCWAYDPFGNRTAESYQTTACPAPAIPSTLTQTVFNSTVNQVIEANGNYFTYDAAGNVLYDGLNSYLYDAEGRLCAVQGYNGNMTGYIYGADGTRVAKGSLTEWSCNIASNGFKATSSYVLGAGGEQLTELTVTGSSGSYSSAWKHTNIFADGKLLATYTGSNTYFALSDWLGTKRAELSAGATPTFSTFFSLPYGNELAASGDATGCNRAPLHRQRTRYRIRK